MALHPSGSGTGHAPFGGTGTYSHEDFTYVRKKRGKLVREEDFAEDTGELNIIPYLDIMVNLIMFLLMAQATLVSLGIIDVTAPSYARMGPAAANPENNAKKKLRLTVGIAREGFFIAAKGGVLPGEEKEGSGELTLAGVERSAPTIPNKPDGDYDYRALTRKLRAIKAAFPDTTSVYVAADGQTSYEVIVRTLDASREDNGGKLFPSVAFTQIR